MRQGIFNRLHSVSVIGLATFLLTVTTVMPNSAQAYGGPLSNFRFTTLQVDTTPIQVFDGPSLKANLLQTIKPDGRVSWDGTAQKAEGRQWLKIQTQTTSGWTAPDSQVLFDVDPYAVTPGITVGASGETAQPVPAYTDSELLVPAVSVGNGAILPVKTAFTVIGGPITTALFTAWQIKIAPNSTAWIPDIPGYFQITAPLTVYGYQVCDGFDLTTFGVPGWDSVVKQFPALITKKEQVQCLASTNFKHDGAPVVMVLAHAESDTDRHDTLYLFAQTNGVWGTLYKETAEAYARTDRIAMYSISTSKNPIVLWAIRNDGTGQYLRVEALQYTANGTKPVLNVPDLYKGNFEIGSDTIKLRQAILKDGEANCCATGFNRQVYQWQTDKFVKVLDDQPPPPYWLQGIPQQ
jgi:hypothetical protein